MVHKLPESEGEARGQGHKSLATMVYLLYSQVDWFNGSVATTNIVTKIVNSQYNYYNWSTSNFLSVYGTYNPPATIETRLKWKRNIQK